MGGVFQREGYTGFPSRVIPSLLQYVLVLSLISICIFYCGSGSTTYILIVTLLAGQRQRSWRGPGADTMMLSAKRATTFLVPLLVVLCSGTNYARSLALYDM